MLPCCGQRRPSGTDRCPSSVTGEIGQVPSVSGLVRLFAVRAAVRPRQAPRREGTELGGGRRPRTEERETGTGRTLGVVYREGGHEDTEKLEAVLWRRVLHARRGGDEGDDVVVVGVVVETGDPGLVGRRGVG